MVLNHQMADQLGQECDVVGRYVEVPGQSGKIKMQEATGHPTSSYKILESACFLYTTGFSPFKRQGMSKRFG